MTDKLSDEWETPPWLWERLSSQFNFVWDVCSTPENNLVGGSINALEATWPKGVVYMNPPYSNVRPFLKRVVEEYRTTTVALLKGDPSTRWWNDYVKDKATLLWIPKRVRFYYQGKPGPHVANFPSVIAIYWGFNLVE